MSAPCKHCGIVVQPPAVGHVCSVPINAEELLLAELAAMDDAVLVEYVLQEDFYTPSHWEAVSRLELERRGKGDLPLLLQQSRCVHAPIFVGPDGTCKACGKKGL